MTSKPLGEPPIPADEIRLRGLHNLDNARAAATAARAARVPDEAVAEALRSFAGVPHRLEEVATVDGVLYVNDSKATNVSSAVRGIESFEGAVHLILGGSLKGGGFEGLREPVAARCRACYLIGEASDRHGHEEQRAPEEAQVGLDPRHAHAARAGEDVPPSLHGPHRRYTSTYSTGQRRTTKNQNIPHSVTGT